MRILLTCLFLLGILTTLFADEVTRFRGKDSQGKYETENNLLKEWPQEGLTPLWIKKDLGEGYGSVIKVDNSIYLGCLDPTNKKMESVICLDLDGNKRWQTTTGPVWSRSYPVPRATPTYYKGVLLFLSGGGELFCLDAKDGKVLWSKELADSYNVKLGFWGFAESVVVLEDKVFVCVCGKDVSVVALDVADGHIIWEAPAIGDNCAYVSPVVHDGQLILMTAQKVFGIDVNSGDLLWEDSYKQTVGPVQRGGINCNTPLVKGNRFFVTSGYDQGSVMYEIAPDRKSVNVAWTSKDLDTHHGNVVEVDGKIYGSNWLNNGTGNWLCLDWETGKTIYNTPWKRLGKGTIIFADGMLYLYEEKRGTVGLVKPGDQFEVISSFPINFGTKEHWAHPVISDGILYVRHGNSLAAFDLRQKM